MRQESSPTLGPRAPGHYPGRQRNTLIALLVASAFFMENLDGTVIATAIPTMARDFAVLPADLGLGISAYLLTLGIFIPISGWMAERFGSRRVFCCALIVFTLASLACALADSLPAFVALRVLQGIGGAMMVPVGRLVLLRSTPQHDLMRVTSMLIWPGLFAPVLGPALGGFITTHASWRWIFYLNIPIGVLALVGAWLLMPAQEPRSERPFDWKGFLWIGSGVACVLWSAELCAQPVLPVPRIALGLAIGIALLLLGVKHLKHHPHPMLSLQPLRQPPFAANIFGGSLFRMSAGAVPFVLPLIFQVGYGMDAFRAGQLVLIVFAGNLAMKLFTTPLIKRFGLRPILLWNGVLNTLALAACALIGPEMSIGSMAVVLFAGGMSRSLQFTALNTLAFAGMLKAMLGASSALFSTASQLALGAGVALGAVTIRIGEWAAPLLACVQAPDLAYRIAFVVVALVSLVAMLDLLGLEPDAGNAESGTAR
ncbi:MAG: putative transport protein HsrA [Stenotrophomonas maltophilia]|uniref:Putative transport protein HsrA n=1 Tax=Stenotrophomonas maltophilia TaxID=40324 RepID=A0A7V8JKL2_STEMA|nr:MAG: putative transport protein HsrA [Stenotrophomonas maltophilia]